MLHIFFLYNPVTEAMKKKSTVLLNILAVQDFIENFSTNL